MTSIKFYLFLSFLMLSHFVFSQNSKHGILLEFGNQLSKTNYKAAVYSKNFRYFIGNLDVKSTKFMCLLNRGVKIDSINATDYYFTESYYDNYHSDNEDLKVVYRQVNEGNSNYTVVVNQPLNVWGKYLNISSRSFPSPFNKNALKYYQFNDTIKNNKRTITITPKGKKRFNLQGKVLFGANNQHIKEVKLYSVNCKLRSADSIFIDLKYHYIDDSIAVLARQRVSYTADFFDFTSYGISTLEMSSFKTRFQRPKIKSKNEIQLYDSDTLRSLKIDPDSLPFFPIHLKEKNVPKFNEIAFLGYYYHTPKGGNSIYLSPLLQMTQFDAYQGWSLDQKIAYKHYFKNHKYLSLKTASKYNASKSKLYSKINLGYSLSVKHPTVFNFEIGSHIRQFNDKNTSDYTGLILFVPESMKGSKVYHYKGIKASLKTEIANGVTLTSTFKTEKRFEIKKSKEYPFEFNPFNKKYINNFPFPNHTATFIAFQLSLKPSQKYFYRNNVKINVKSYYPVFELEYQKAIPKLFQSQVDYGRVAGAISQEFKTNAIGVFSYKINGEKLINKKSLISLADFNHINGSKVSLFGDQKIDDLHLLNDYRLDNNGEFIQINLKNDFNSLLTSKIPGLKSTNTKVVAEFHQVFTRGNSYSELSFGIYNLFTVLNLNLGVADLNGNLKVGFRFGISIPNPSEIK